MTDVHSHILFGIDDGSYSIEESIELLKKLKKVGFNNVILTPHYIIDSSYSANNEIKRRQFIELKKAVEENKIKINLFLGNEIFISNDIISLLEQDEILSLNNTKYLLIELPFHNQIINLPDIIHELKLKGYAPVIAHPERYTYFQENYELVDELKNEDVLFQCNYTSITGYYGKQAQKLLKYMLKNKYVSYLGTDIHHLDRLYFIDNFDKIIKSFNKIAGENYFKRIINNCNKLVSSSIE